MKTRVEVEGRFRTRKEWFEMNTQQLHEFPRLTEEYLRDLTMGVYQLKLSKSYVQDKMERDSAYNFEVMLEEPGVLRARTFSRFSAAAKHQLWIGFNEDVEYESYTEQVPEEPILSWYCTYKSGARTVGCCAHIASVLWFLGFARHQRNVRYPSNMLLSTFKDSAHRDLPTIF